MVYKKQEWFELKRNGIKFELIVRDQDFAKLEVNTFTPQNFNNVMKEIGKRYGIGKKQTTTTREIQDEIDWMKKEKIIN